MRAQSVDNSPNFKFERRGRRDEHADGSQGRGQCAPRCWRARHRRGRLHQGVGAAAARRERGRGGRPSRRAASAAAPGGAARKQGGGAPGCGRVAVRRVAHAVRRRLRRVPRSRPRRRPPAVREGDLPPARRGGPARASGAAASGGSATRGWRLGRRAAHLRRGAGAACASCRAGHPPARRAARGVVGAARRSRALQGEPLRP